jgi:P-type Cu+ transporter
LIPIAGGALVPLLGVGIFGWLPMLAAVAMAMSSVTVVGNSILLGRYKPKVPLTTVELQRASVQHDTDTKAVSNNMISKTSLG